MSRWLYAWRDVRNLLGMAWKRQKERDAQSWWPAYERFWSYIAWPFAYVLALVMVPLVAFTYEPKETP